MPDNSTCLSVRQQNSIQTGWLKEQAFISHSSEGCKSLIRGCLLQFLVRMLFLVCRDHLLSVLTVWREELALWSLLIKTLSSRSHLNLITSVDPISNTIRMVDQGFNIWIWGWKTNIQSITLPNIYDYCPFAIYFLLTGLVLKTTF